MRGRVRHTLAAIGAAAGVAAALFLAWRTLEALLLIFSGLLFALFLSAITDWVAARTPLGRGFALAAVVLALFASFALVFWLRGPSIAEQVGELREQLPRAVERLRERVGQYELGRRILDEAPSAGEIFSDRDTVLARATGVVSGTLGMLANLFIIILLGIFIAAEPRAYLNGLVRLVSPRRRERVRDALVEAGGAIRSWLLSKVVRMVFIGVATWIALKLLGVPVAMPLAVLAALLTFVPNFGPIIAAVPAVLLALVQGVATALWVVALYVAIQVIEGSVLDPILTKKVVSLPPALTFGAQIVLGVLTGPIGVAVATPLVAGVVVLVERLYVQDALGEGGGSSGSRPEGSA